MAYVLNLFTPETWRAFRAHGSGVTGFSRAHLARAKNLVKSGDVFVCYVVGLSRWSGALEVLDGPFEDDSPIFQDANDPWVIRFHVKPIVELDFDYAIPIRDASIWNYLERTKEVEQNSVGWGVRAGLQSSLVRVSDADGKMLLDSLLRQEQDHRIWPMDENEQKRLAKVKPDVVRTVAGPVNVVVPENETLPDVRITDDAENSVRESIRVQAQVVEIGAKMGFKAWVPRNDRQRVTENLSEDAKASLITSQLPLNYNDATLKTIENIDVLWMKNRGIVRAFEIEHTTAIYSGLLRMADLLSLQPNIDIKLHIVAPDERREKVLAEVQRPVFSLLENGPLSNSCSFLSYTAVESLHSEPRLAHLRDSILEELEEFAQLT